MTHPARQVALILMSLALPLLSNSASAQSPDTAPRQDWPQFRGPSHDGKSAAKGLLQQWPEGGPKLLWSAQGIGKGFSQVTAAGELLYVSGLVDKQGVIHAYSRDGKLRWEATYGPEWVKNYPGARSVPTVRDGPVYVASGVRNVACIDGNRAAGLQVACCAFRQILEDRRELRPPKPFNSNSYY